MRLPMAKLAAEVTIVGRNLALSLGSLLSKWVRSKSWGIIAGGSKWGSKGTTFLILLTRFSRSGIQAPLGLERLLNFLGVGELEVADFSWEGGALSNRVELGDKLGLETAGLLGVEVTCFLRDIK